MVKKLPTLGFEPIAFGLTEELKFLRIDRSSNQGQGHNKRYLGSMNPAWNLTTLHKLAFLQISWLFKFKTGQEKSAKKIAIQNSNVNAIPMIWYLIAICTAASAACSSNFALHRIDVPTYLGMWVLARTYNIWFLWPTCCWWSNRVSRSLGS